MEDYKLKKYKIMLENERDRLGNSLENINNNPEDAELSKIDNHPADAGTELFMREQDEGFKVSYKNTLKEIESSLISINDGTYGTCSTCGGKIDEDRLEAIPYSFECIECMKDHESKDGKIYESLEEDYITKKSGSRDNVQFDREDSYQELAAFEKIPKDPSYSTGDLQGIIDDEDEEYTEKIENISQEYYDKTLE